MMVSNKITSHRERFFIKEKRMFQTVLMDCFFRFISAALRKIKFLLKANVAKRVRLIFARVAHATVTQNWLFVSMACKITLVTVNRASRGTENIVKVWPFLIDTAQLGPKPIWNSIKNFIDCISSYSFLPWIVY